MRPAGASAFITPIFLPSCAASLSRRNRRAEIAPTCSSVKGSASGSGAAAAAGKASAGGGARRASSRARRPNRARPTRRTLSLRSAAGPRGSAPATGCSRRWQSSRTPCPLLRRMRRALRRLAGRRANGAPSTKSILGARGPRRSTGRCNGLFSEETWAQVHGPPGRDVARRCRSQANRAATGRARRRRLAAAGVGGPAHGAAGAPDRHAAIVLVPCPHGLETA